jgi:hypothetical protein
MTDKAIFTTKCNKFLNSRLQEDTILTKAIMEKIDLADLIASCRGNEPTFVFKLLICIPTLSPDSPHRPFCEMIKKKLTVRGGCVTPPPPSKLTWQYCIHELELLSILFSHFVG